MNSSERPGQIITFYSYKWGTGRTMSLANLACLLAQQGDGDRSVLAIDWDLEAPGLHLFFRDLLARGTKDRAKVEPILNEGEGLIDLLIEIRKRIEQSSSLSTEGGHQQTEGEVSEVLQAIDFNRFVLPTEIPNLYLLKAGRFDEDYARRVNTFNWEGLYNHSPWLFQCFADFLADRYEYVLIDSRTGRTDTSNICTMLMPQKLVVVFTPNRQSLTGVEDLVRQATAYRRKSDDIRPLLVYPLPSRIENSEPERREQWRFGNEELEIAGYQKTFERIFKEAYELPTCDLTGYFDDVQIQHVPSYAYGEELATLTERATDVSSLHFRFKTFCDWMVAGAPPWLADEKKKRAAPVLRIGQALKLRELDMLKGHTRSVGGVAMSGDRRLAVSASNDKTLKVWDLETRSELRTLQGHTSFVNAVAMSEDGRLAVSASADRTLKVWDVESGRELRTLAGHSSFVNGVALSGDGRLAVSASADYTLKVWDVEAGIELFTLKGHSRYVNGAAVRVNGRLAVSASADHTLKVWEVQSGRELSTLKGHSGFVNGVALSGDGRLAVSASEDQTLKVWKLANGRKPGTLSGHTDSVLGVAVSGDGWRAVSASADKTVKLWDLSKRRELASFGTDAELLCCAVSSDEEIILAGDVDGTIHYLALE